jgi:hypothetical protein
MRALACKTAQLGEVVAAAFDEAAHCSVRSHVETGVASLKMGRETGWLCRGRV